MESKNSNDNLNYDKFDFPGMRESGKIIETDDYVIAEYEDKDLRLIPIAKLINPLISQKFILYDYKGFIYTDNEEVIRVLNAKYFSSIPTFDGDTLIISDKLLKINASNNINKSNKIVIPTEIEMSTASPSFGIKSIASTIASIIRKIPCESGMMIGIFGKWGRGKTYFAECIKDYLINEKTNNDLYISFSAWKYQDRDSLWAHLYETMVKEYLNDKKSAKFFHYFENKIKIFKLNIRIHKLWNIIYFLLLLTFQVYFYIFLDKTTIIKYIFSTFNVIILCKIYFIFLQQKNSALGLLSQYLKSKNFSKNLGLQAEIEFEIENLLMTWIPKKIINKKIILLIDDIDRGDVKNIIDVIDGLRTILNNPEIQKRLIILTAVDDTLLKQSLNIKYSKLPEKEIIEKLYSDYLQKVFILGIKLNDLKKSEIREFTENLIPKGSIIKNVVDKSVNTILNTVNGAFNNNIKVLSNSIENIKKVSEINEAEITNKERLIFIELIDKLNNATPRSISILFYKYLIIKKLLAVKLAERGIDIHNTELNDTIIIKSLITRSNGSIAGEKYINELDPIIRTDFVNVLDMLSIL